MKPQDIVLLLLIIALLWKRNPRHFVIAGISMLVLAIPLFAKFIFFTAERLTMYAGLCMLIAVIILIFKERKNNK